MASESAARCAPSRFRSCLDRASVRSERIRSSNRCPLSVELIRETRRSVASRSRRTSPNASRFGMSRESIVGFKPTSAARSERRIGPRRSAATRTSTSDGVSASAAALARSRFDRRPTAIRKRAALNPSPSSCKEGPSYSRCPPIYGCASNYHIGTFHAASEGGTWLGVDRPAHHPARRRVEDDGVVHPPSRVGCSVMSVTDNCHMAGRSTRERPDHGSRLALAIRVHAHHRRGPRQCP